MTARNEIPQLQPILLSSAFVAFLTGSDETTLSPTDDKLKAIYALRPVFAAKCERLASTKKQTWLPRALLVSADGVLRLVEPGNGRVTHCINVLDPPTPHNNSTGADGDPASAQRLSQLIVVVEDLPIQTAATGPSPSRCVRIMGWCPRSTASGDLETCDVTLRFPAPPSADKDADNAVALKFAAALQFFGGHRSECVSASCLPYVKQFHLASDRSFIMTRSKMPADDPSMRSSYLPHGQSPSTTKRPLPQAASTISVAGKLQLETAARRGDITVVPTVAPPPYVPPAVVKGEEAALAAEKLTLLSEDDLLKLLTRRDLETVPVEEQEDDHIPASFITFMESRQKELKSLQTRNEQRRRISRLLQTRLDHIEAYRRFMCVERHQAWTAWLHATLALEQAATTAFLDALDTAAQGLLRPPCFSLDRHYEEMFEKGEACDALEDEAKALAEEKISIQNTAQRVRQGDPSHEALVIHSERALKDLMDAQRKLEICKREAADACDDAVNSARAACERTLAVQSQEIERLQLLLHKLESVFVLHDELRNLPARSSVTPREIRPEDLTHRQRMDRMKLDV